MNIFIKLIIGCVFGLLSGALMLCFEAMAFMLPFVVTLMILSGAGIIIFGVLWLFNTGYQDLL